MARSESSQDVSPTDAAKHPTAKAAEQLFAQCPYGVLRELSCEYEGDSLVLYGRVPTYYLKSIAQTVARGVAGVRQIENRIEVAESGSHARAPSRGPRALAGVA